jgi:hypothetical protein
VLGLAFIVAWIAHRGRWWFGVWTQARARFVCCSHQTACARWDNNKSKEATKVAEKTTGAAGTDQEATDAEAMALD